MIDVLEKASRAGGEVLLGYFRKKLEVVYKAGHNNIVTQADTLSQKTIKTVIFDQLSKKGINKDTVGFIGEEDLNQEGDHLFVIDPLDGTSNFATGEKEFCVLIAYFYRLELKAGVIYFPLSDSLYIAEKGSGAYNIKNGLKKPISNEKKELHHIFLYSSLSYDDDIKKGLPRMIMALQPIFRGVRMVGCAGTEFALLVNQIAGGVLNLGCRIWDIAAAKLILEESGYCIFDLEGNEILFDFKNPNKQYPFLACHSSYKKKLLEILGKFIPI